MDAYIFPGKILDSWITGVSETIDAFTEKATSLAKAREEGETRKHWILTEMDKITEGRSEDEKAMVASAISSINERTIQESLTEE